MKKIPLIIFIIFSLFLGGILIFKQVNPPIETDEKAKVVIPTHNTLKTDEQTSTIFDDISLISFLPLAPEETLLNTYTADINGDNYDDQISAIKKASSPHIILLIGIYNPEMGQYERQDEINTNITQVNSFNYSTMDITGNLKIDLVYSGFNESNQNILRVHSLQNQHGDYELKTIADFCVNGTILIQQVQRNDRYAMGVERGECFPIWIYTVDSEKPNSLDQFQYLYKWNEECNEYLLMTETRISGKKITAKELAKIQDGKVSTFVKFLDGLWYKTENKNNKYLFFDEHKKEIIFLADTTQEVYRWVNSTLRRNGIYLSTVNASIQNLSRRFDITLVGTDEIRVKLSDDLRMIIGEETMWDGNYKKMQQRTSDEIKEELSEIAKIFSQESQWITQDETTFTFSKDKYFITKNTSSDQGHFIIKKIQGKEILQLRSENTSSNYTGFYLVNIKNEAKENKTVKILELIPVRISLQTIFEIPTSTITLEEINKE